MATVRASDTALPGQVQQSGTPEQRGDRYGETFVQDLNTDRYAEEGGLFVARSATLGTGIAQTANTTEDTTKPFIVGGVPSTVQKSVRLVRLLLRPTAVSSGQTIQNISVITTSGAGYASAGTDYNILVTGVNATVGYTNIGRSGANNASVLASLRVGVPVAALVSPSHLQTRWSPRTTTIPVVGDEYVTYFGNRAAGGPEVGHVQPVSTTINRYVKVADPVIVEPGTAFMVVLWAAGIGGAMSWEFELVWAER